MSPHGSAATSTAPPWSCKIPALASALNCRLGSTWGKSVSVTLAPSSAAAAIPTSPVPEPSSRKRRRLSLGSKAERAVVWPRRWLSRRVTRAEAAGQSWKERPWRGAGGLLLWS
ncbi:UNVERIFIED_CONTAM: hypothetical protein Sangu_2731600 [Sesamum angustifolium]|uniref:Uncharacterized protein n=1 Tax=Sesamum angustifolium TaxID=2727405 RepID=A0AAW2IWA1_9LAMI